MEKFFLFLYKMFNALASTCKKLAGRIAEQHLKIPAVTYSVNQFVELIDEANNKRKAITIGNKYVQLGLSCMDLAMAFGWMRSSGKSESASLITLESYLHMSLSKADIRQKLLDLIIQRPGTLIGT